MQSIAKTMAYQAASSRAKVAFSRHKLAYLISAMLGGAYIGIAVVLMLTAAGPFHAAGSPATALVSGLTFSIALSLVTVAGGELATSNMMTLVQGAVMRAVTTFHATVTLTFCFIANLLGGILFGSFVYFSGVLKTGTAGYAYMTDYLGGKLASSNVELLFKAILCNALVCLAVWSGLRLRTEGAKLFMIFLCLLAFITSGFEHVVANMTTFTLGLWLEVPGLDVPSFGRNLAIVGLGNLIGGALIGLAYLVISRRIVPVAPVGAAPEQTTSHRP